MEKNSASFRDPNGFIFTHKGKIYRQINKSYQKEYDLFIHSGLSDELLKNDLIIAHENASTTIVYNTDAYAILSPKHIPFISYPYEWSFGMLQDAALTTLAIERYALEHKMSLQDASAYNIQFIGSHPIFIDITSFECYREGAPWTAYKQFCQHFLAPLVMASQVDIRFLNHLFHALDGIDLDFASKLLPKKTWFQFGLLTHLHLHAQLEKHTKKNISGKNKWRIPLVKRKRIIEHLDLIIRSLSWKPEGTDWASYDRDGSYTSQAFEHKRKIISEWISIIRPQIIWDLGAHSGMFSRMATGQHISCVSIDSDMAASEKTYQDAKTSKNHLLLSLVIDLSQPSPSLGWAHRERMSLTDRGPADLVLVLALTHHLAITHGIPFELMASWFALFARTLIIEFIPKADPRIRQLLIGRDDVFYWYFHENFLDTFSKFFIIEKEILLTESSRILYRMKNKNSL